MVTQKENAAAITANERASRINLIKSAFSASLKTGKLIDKNLLIYELCAKFNVSRRTALEYINIAFYAMNNPAVFSLKTSIKQKVLKI